MLNLVVFKREVRDKLKVKCLIVFVNILGRLSAEKGQMVAIFSSFFLELSVLYISSYSSQKFNRKIL